MTQVELPLPPRLIQLVDASCWPLTHAEMNMQYSAVSIYVTIPQGWIEEGERLCLRPPPFPIVSESGNQDFWRKFCAPSELNFDLAREIGDFGIGSDAPLVLDYQEAASEPKVRRLRWTQADPIVSNNHWETLADTFESFASALDLESLDWAGARKHLQDSFDRFRPINRKQRWRLW